MKVGKKNTNERIAFDKVGPYKISTILTSETWNGEPRYETAVFNTTKITVIEPLGKFEDVEEEADCETLEEALEQHKRLLNKYRSTLKW